MEAVISDVPSIELGVIVPEGVVLFKLKANFGEVRVMVVAVHAVLVAPLSIFKGAKSSLTIMSVSADCVNDTLSKDILPKVSVK